MALYNGELVEAEHYLRRPGGSNDLRMLNALVWMKIERGAGLGDLAAEAGERELGPIAKRLVPMAKKAAHFDLRDSR